MTTIARGVKRGNVRTFQESFVKGYQDIWATEVDADLDILFDTWNSGYPGNLALADNSVTTAKLADNAVTNQKLAPNSVGSGNIIDGSIVTVDIQDGAITAAKLAPGIITPPVLADGAVTTPKIADLAVTTPKIADNAVTAAKIIDAAITTAKIQDGAVTDAKIASLAWAKITGAPTGLPPSGPAGGSLNGTYPNPTFKPNSVTSAEILDGAISVAELAPDVAGRLVPPSTSQDWGRMLTVDNATGAAVWREIPPQALAQNQIVEGNLQDGCVTGAKILDGTIGVVDLSAATIARLVPPYTTAESNYILSVSGAGNSLVWGPTPPASLTPNQVTTQYIGLAPSGVATTNINDGAVTDAKIVGVAWGKVTGAPTSYPPSGPAGGRLSGTYPNPTLAANAVDSANITDGSVIGSKLAGGSVTCSKFSPSPTIPADEGKMILVGSGGTIAYGTVATTLPPSGAAGGDLAGTYPNPTLKPITNAQIANGAITEQKISPNKLWADNVLSPASLVGATTLLDGSVTAVKLSADAKSKWKVDTVATALTPIDPGINTINILGSSTVKSYIVGSVAGADVGYNNAWAPQDATKASWQISMANTPADLLTIYHRKPNAAAGAAESLLTLNNIGWMNLFIDGGGIGFGSGVMKGQITNSSAGSFTFNVNHPWGPQDATKASWYIDMNATADVINVWHRNANAASGAVAAPFAIRGSDGKTLCSLADASVTRGMLAPQCTVRGYTALANPGQAWVIPGKNAWYRYASGTINTTTGTYILAEIYPNLLCWVAGASPNEMYVRLTVGPNQVYQRIMNGVSVNLFPFSGFTAFMGSPGTMAAFCAFDVYCAANSAMLNPSSGDAGPGSMWVYELT